eukprot:10696795-Alexandrium_andersonii.AAC.1
MGGGGAAVARLPPGLPPPHFRGPQRIFPRCAAAGGQTVPGPLVRARARGVGGGKLRATEMPRF